eukprot:scaffold4847_cov89-Cylindrotheca_fusiformis.AAC.10
MVCFATTLSGACEDSSRWEWSKNVPFLLLSCQKVSAPCRVELTSIYRVSGICPNCQSTDEKASDGNEDNAISDSYPLFSLRWSEQTSPQMLSALGSHLNVIQFTWVAFILRSTVSGTWPLGAFAVMTIARIGKDKSSSSPLV